LSDAANRAKGKWNPANYRQAKVSVAPEIAAAFQAACAAACVSMASVLSAHMADFGKSGAKARPPPGMDLSTRRKRCQALVGPISKLGQIRAAQERLMGDMPESLQGAGAYESAEESIALMDGAIELLDAVY
jgi:poly(A) polymerase Pap1